MCVYTNVCSGLEYSSGYVTCGFSLTDWGLLCGNHQPVVGLFARRVFHHSVPPAVVIRPLVVGFSPEHVREKRRQHFGV